MVKIDKEYVFDGPEGNRSLHDLFETRWQLIVYHFMFDPEWEKGCPGCTGYVDALGDLSMLHDRDTSFVLISRAPLAKLEAYKALKGWNVPWYSSFGSDFNYDLHVTVLNASSPRSARAMQDGVGLTLLYFLQQLTDFQRGRRNDLDTAPFRLR
jgi:predicted dithiol-disulfide oxidoreductase (DUF899 family)